MHVQQTNNLGITKNDFTTLRPYLFCCSGFALIRDIAAFLERVSGTFSVQLLGWVAFLVYLIFDTQLVLGRGTYSCRLEDAYFASIQLYVDVVEIFLQILNFLNGSKR
jgi:FtsH-binding integral membrane protein